MNSILNDIFRAIHEGKWLHIEYQNRDNQVTKYWIGIRSMNIQNRTLTVDGLHLGQLTVKSLDWVRIDGILSSQIVEGSYYPVNKRLVDDIYMNPEKYRSIFGHTVNLKILSYLEMCNRMDTVPYLKDFALIHYLDREKIQGEEIPLSTEQFQQIVKNFQYQTEQVKNEREGLHIRQLAMNVLSIHTSRGLYVLAYRKLNLDVKARILRPEQEITVCTEFTLDGVVQSVRQFLDAEDYELLENFEKNQENIKECIRKRMSGNQANVDDMPYVIGLAMDIPLDLHKEYKGILKMYKEGDVSIPVKAFFGELLERPRRTGAYPMALLNRKVNMDQLLAIHNAMKYPVAYIQGPPGTGKTNTIINTIVTAFFNERTVLFSSYNNHPISGVYEKLSKLQYEGKTILFPILRLGNAQKVNESLIMMRRMYEQAQSITVYEATLDRNKDERKRRARKLSELLKKYEELLDLREREETIDRLLEYEQQNSSMLQMVPFTADLEGRQKRQIEKRRKMVGTVSEDEVFSLLDDKEEELRKYLYYISAAYIKKLNQPSNAELREIILMDDEGKRKDRFQKYLSKKKNISNLQKIFPVIATTCISAHRLGEAEPMFDMVIMDEASQCNLAVSLVPIIRGKSLMLVGDPQQLSPVILLDEMTNCKLKKRYGVSDEYDYRKNSIYKTYLSCDAVSDETLLKNHYRCNQKIIGFNNRKYYNSKLKIKTQSRESQPLLYVDMQNAKSLEKNTSPSEAKEIVRYVMQHQDKSIGIITPFVNQKNLIEKELKLAQMDHVVCGTVHAFQGDEKDIILFSTAITDQTQKTTYEWLKNNKELINVATSRAKDKLILMSSRKNLERLHSQTEQDDLYELAEYVWSNGNSIVTPKHANSRALGVKPFSSATEEAFLQNLNHALENIWMTQSRYTVHKEVAISHVFWENESYNDLFYSGRFDFVVYEKAGDQEIPLLAIELDGKEHFENEIVKNRDKKKNEICREHDLQLIRVENSYARRYNYMKEILMNYFSVMH